MAMAPSGGQGPYNSNDNDYSDFGNNHYSLDPGVKSTILNTQFALLLNVPLSREKEVAVPAGSTTRSQALKVADREVMVATTMKTRHTLDLQELTGTTTKRDTMEELAVKLPRAEVEVPR
jgi:hypothetical protein